MITLRPVQPEGDAFLRAVYASTRAAEMALVDWSTAEKAAFLQMQYDAQRHHYLTYYPNTTYQVIQRDALDIGRLIVQRPDASVLLMDMALLPEQRNQGIGTYLVQALQTEAAAASKPLRLSVEIFNPALRLYHRLGFTPVEQTGIHLRMEWLPPCPPFAPNNNHAS